GGGGGSTGGFAARSDAAQAGQGSATVDCPAGDGTVTCNTGRGLAPGERVVLMFRLVADSGAQSGEVTGTVNAGAAIRVSVGVPVIVKAAPDAVSLDVSAVLSTPLPWLQPTLLTVDVRNDGPSTKPVTVTVDQPARLIL